MEMAQSDHSNSSPRKRALDWLNPSSKWTQDEYGALPAASEPYDWTLKDGEIRPTQVIPITSPVRRSSTKLGWLKRKPNVSESSATIKLGKSSTGKIFSRRITRLLRPATTRPLVESGGTEARRKSPGWALPLLLLAVIALFVFAYIAQK
ncbi:MAG TPA: hypothetical protein VE715_18310 [Blastocatellia bacterium]|nr:hypothetical protein [Blastocatellia bacterium]